MGLAGKAEDQRHAEEQYRRSYRAQQQVFQGSFGGLGVFQETHQGIKREVDQFQGNEEGDQFGGGGHQHHAQGGKQYQGIIFTLEMLEFGDIIGGGQDHQNGNAQRKAA